MRQTEFGAWGEIATMSTTFEYSQNTGERIGSTYADGSWPETTPEPTRPPWYAIRVKSNCEKIVAIMLNSKGLEEFLPLYRVRRRWSDRYKTLELPLFPGYLFCRLSLERRQAVVTTPGFLHIVGVGRIPVPVDEQEITAIQSMVRSGLPLTPWPSLAVGQKVCLLAGPLYGLEGVISRVGGQRRVFVSITLLNRSVSVEVDRDWIRVVYARQRFDLRCAEVEKPDRSYSS